MKQAGKTSGAGGVAGVQAVLERVYPGARAQLKRRMLAVARLLGRSADPTLLAEVRGVGLIFGAEFVLDDAMTPATGFVTDVVESMVQRGFILNRIGRAANTLKIRPPMPFSVENADMLMDALQDVLAETPVPR
jgi:4-aminobutyrate aminotransferase-like enzyme